MNPTEIEARRRDAFAYLREQLGEHTPNCLHLQGAFDESPLEGEGRTLLFSFDFVAPGATAVPEGSAGAALRHYVAVGETAPNYFPAYGLNADDAYSFHVGTRFMLEMALNRVETDLEPPGARDAMRRFVAEYARGAPVEQEELAALFRCEDGYFAVYRLTLGGEPVYCLGADCPPGFCRMAEHPPQAALRLHLGRLIRLEAKKQADAAGGQDERNAGE